MKRLAFFIALTAGWPSSAQERQLDRADYRSMEISTLEQHYRQLDIRWPSNPCPVVPLLAEMARRKIDQPAYGYHHVLALAFCDISRDRYPSALNHLEKLAGTPAEKGIETLALFAAVRSGNEQKTLDWLRRAAEAGSLTDMMRAESDGVMQSFSLLSRSSLKAEHIQLCELIARKSWFGDAHLSLQTWCATTGIQDAIKRGDLSRVSGLLQFVHVPRTLIIMLADRAYEPAWPLIEAHVGKNLETATDGFVALTAEKLSRNPADTSWLNFHMMALLGAGRDEEAAERTGKLLAEKTANGVINEQDAWALDFQTKALMALGRNDEANAVYDRLVTPRQDSWMVNFSINRAAALLRQRRWAAALDAFKIARKHADQHGTTYARILVARGTGLALYKLGRVSEVGTEANYLIRNAEGYLPFVLDGLLCVGRREDAERIAKSAVRRGDVSGQFVEQIQDTRFDITDVPDMSGEAPICPSMREFILANDELREPILKKVRLLPDHLIPIGQIRRQERLSASTRSL